MPEQTRAETCKRYRQLAVENRRLAAELLRQGTCDLATSEAVKGLLQDAHDNELIAASFDDRLA